MSDAAYSAGPALTLDPTIFREYDIRGTVGKNITADFAFQLGCAYGTFCRNQGFSSVAVGYDGRMSSPVLADALMHGIMRTGCQVLLVGMGPSPMLYFAVKHIPTDAGIMVTGSHNPSDMNGFKMLTKNGPVFGDTIQHLRQIMESQNYVLGQGAQHNYVVNQLYVERLLKDLDLNGTHPNVAWDAGNGAAGAVLPDLTAKMPGQHLLLYADVDGRFPNHHPDPTVDENLVDLIAAVKTNKCDLGIAFDGDGDRIGVVDETGGVIRCDMLLALYAREVLQNHPGAAIIGDIKCSTVLFDEVARLGGKPVLWKTGHSLIKQKMAEERAPLAGELSGHIFFADKYYGFDDGLYCAVRLLNEVARADGKLSSLFAHLPRLYNTPELRFDVEETEKFGLIDAMRDAVKHQIAGRAGWEMVDIDGVRVNTPEGWWLMRASNTQAVLVSRCEASSAEGLDRMKDAVKEAGAAVGLEVNFPA
jgi:phosphomannomutase